MSRERFKDARMDLSLSIPQCAELLNVSVSTIKRYEQHKPSKLALNYLEIRAGNFTHLGKWWRNIWVDRDGFVTDGRRRWPPTSYYSLDLYKHQTRILTNRVKRLEAGGQLDLFAGYAPE